MKANGNESAGYAPGTADLKDPLYVLTKAQRKVLDALESGARIHIGADDDTGYVKTYLRIEYEDGRDPTTLNEATHANLLRRGLTKRVTTRRWVGSYYRISGWGRLVLREHRAQEGK